MLRGYLADLHARGLARTSIARRLATLRSFFRFLCGGAAPGSTRPARSGRPSLPGRLPAHLPIDQSEALFRQPLGDDEAGRRDRAILEVLYATGVRVAELSGLDMEDVDLREGSVRVLGKGRKERIVPLGAKAVEALRAYLGARESAPGPALPEPPGRAPHGAEPPPDRPAPARGRPGSPGGSRRTRSATRSPPTSSTPERTSA